MKISNSDTFAQWKNNLSVAKSMQEAKDSTLGQVKQGENVKPSEIEPGGYTPTNTKIYDVNSFLSQRDYTIDDALDYQFRKYGSISADDIMSGTVDQDIMRETISITETINKGDSLPEEFANKLKEIARENNEYDYGRESFYLSRIDYDGDLDKNVDYLSSGFATMKKRINEHLVGEEKDKLLEQLELNFQKEIEKIADKTSKEMGGFFEENGVVGETEKIYESILKAYEDGVNKYSTFVENNDDYILLSGKENEWLKKDDSYLASELRKIEKDEDNTSNVESDGYYSLEELKQTNIMITEIQKYSLGSKNEREITINSTEEEIGFKFAEIAIKGDLFHKNTNVSESLKEAMNLAIDTFMDNTVEILNEKLEDRRARVAEPEKSPDYNREIIDGIYNKVMGIYRQSDDAAKALSEGGAYAKQQHLNRTKDSILIRDQSSFWKNFNGIKPSESGYANQETEIETSLKSWNDFASTLTDKDELLIKHSSFSVYV